MSHIAHWKTDLTMETIIERSVVDEAGCWVWKGRLDVNGYAVYGKADKVRVARFAWECDNLREMPGDLYACHKCTRTKSCVNPKHIYAGTPSENVIDQYRSGRIQWRHTQKLRDSEVLAVKMLLAEGQSCRRIARTFSVSHTTVVKIKNGERFRDVQPQHVATPERRICYQKDPSHVTV